MLDYTEEEMRKIISGAEMDLQKEIFPFEIIADRESVERLVANYRKIYTVVPNENGT